MQWLDRARAAVRSAKRLSLPDPDRVDAGSVPDTALLISAIAAALPRTAILQLIGPRNPSLLPFLLARSIARRRSTGEYFFSLGDDSVTALARAAACFGPDEVCSHLLVQDGEHTLLEAFGRDKGEDVVWLSRRLPQSRRQRFLEIVSAPTSPLLPGARAAHGPAHPNEEGHTMLRIAVPGLAALMLLACVQRPALVIETSTGDVVRLESWRASLSSPSGLSGTATLAPGGTHRETLATIAITGAQPRAAHAWYAHLGECGRDLGILIGPQAYAPLVADDQGDAHSSVTLPFTVPTNGTYFVSVRASGSEGSGVIACGNLTRENAAGGPAIAEARSQ